MLLNSKKGIIKNYLQKKNLMKFTIAKIPLEKRMEFIEKNLSLIKKEYIELKKYSESLGLIFFATPFDIDSADFLHHEIKIPLFKLASSDLNNFIDQKNFKVIKTNDTVNWVLLR